MTIWAVFQQCNFQISLSIYTSIPLSLIQVNHTKWSKSINEIWAADVEMYKNVKETFICKQ